MAHKICAHHVCFIGIQGLDSAQNPWENRVGTVLVVHRLQCRVSYFLLEWKQGGKVFGSLHDFHASHEINYLGVTQISVSVPMSVVSRAPNDKAEI